MSKSNNATLLACRDLCKSYHDGNRELHVLRGVNLAVREGERLAIVGPSGAGKSTLLHCIAALDKPTSGEIQYRGEPVHRMGRAAINRLRNESIGFVFQFYHLLPEFTALENVMMPGLNQGRKRKECQDRAEALLERVGLADRMTHKPGELSGGEQQRVAIARALYNQPGLILADEPTGNLDEHTGQGIIQLLWELNEAEGATLLLVTHDTRVASEAGRIVQLHEGVLSELS